ncbi:MAG: dTDP-glucose 4,6-dehydratase [Pseudomonadota bacterium]
MQNMLITGGCGFIGTNFIRYLLTETDFKGCIVNVDALTYAGNPENLADIETDFQARYVFIKADICDGVRMNEIFDKYEIDSVCHFAAESHVDRSIVKPDAFIQTNIVGTFNLLESARSRQNQLVRFHHISTDEVYGSLGREGCFTEETPYKPNSPYSASKASSDHLVRAYYKTYGLPMTISNCSNNYGPYQFPEKLIPLMILNGLAGKSMPVYGDGRNIRDWLYVRDHCRAIWTIMNRGKPGETYNVGGDSQMENIAIVEMICDMLDQINKLSDRRPRRDLIKFVKDRPGHDRRYAVDFTKLNQELGWTPEASLESGIRDTIQWYLDNRKWVERVQSGEYQDWIESHYK